MPRGTLSQAQRDQQPNQRQSQPRAPVPRRTAPLPSTPQSQSSSTVVTNPASSTATSQLRTPGTPKVPVPQRKAPLPSTPQSQSSSTIVTSPAPSTATSQPRTPTSQLPSKPPPQQSTVPRGNVAASTGEKRPYPFQNEIEMQSGPGVRVANTKRAKTVSVKNDSAQIPVSISPAPAPDRKVETSSNTSAPAVVR